MINHYFEIFIHITYLISKIFLLSVPIFPWKRLGVSSSRVYPVKHNT